MSDQTVTAATILVFVALPEEHDRLLEYFPPEDTTMDKQFVFVKHKVDVEGFRLISVLATGMGIENAHEATTAAIGQFKPDMVVCLGIAGSLTTDLKLGDIGISAEIIDISQNMKISEVAPTRRRRTSNRTRTSRPQPSRTVVELSPKALPTQAELTASFRFLRSHPDLRGLLATWVEDAAARRATLIGGSDDGGLIEELVQHPVAEIGSIISGPVVASNAFKDTLKKIDRKVLAVETESSGVFRAAQAANIPCITIRGISDHADINKNVLERTTKQAARKLAADNAISYFSIQLQNPTFLRVALSHLQTANQPELFGPNNIEPDRILRKISKELDSYLEKMSPEYKHRPNNTNLPIPRISRDVVDESLDVNKARMPKSIFDSLLEARGIYIKLPKSFPNQTLAWSVGQALLRHEIDGKQVLPLVISGDELIPPSKGIIHATGVDPNDSSVIRDFSPVIVISEPQFHSEPKIGYLVAELEKYISCPLVVVSRAESPTSQIDRVKTELALVDHVTAPVPFHEIATYLEAAFAMQPAEADSVASRLDETFSRFRLHTHPAYFVGLQEATIDALIQANHRAELIQLAVDGLLSFVVAFDESPVKLSRTTREEFLTELAFLIRVESRRFSKDELYNYVREFGSRKALEVVPEEFLRGYFAVGLLNDTSGCISFSVPYLEAYLLSERLRGDPATATKYFNPNSKDFDQFTFDLYVERGACDEVVHSICEHASRTLAECEEDQNVFLSKKVKPRALSTPLMLLNLAEQLSQAAVKMTERSDLKAVRQEKQRLIDTKEAVRGRVASRDPQIKIVSDQDRSEFELLDNLSRSSVLLATVIGSGAERLDGITKEKVGGLILSIYERYLHQWTSNRMGVDFGGLREELKSDDALDKIIAELNLYDEPRDDVRDNLNTFLDDAELRLLTGPASLLFHRISQYAGVRSLRPIFPKMKPENRIQKLFRDVWLMDVEHNDGKSALKDSLQRYKGSPVLRLVVTNHLMNRIFWHHWQRESRAAFLDVAKYSLAPLGLRPADEHAQKMLRGPRK